MAIMIKTPQEIEKMRVSGIALRKVHDAIAPHVVAGASTMDLEEIAVAKISELGGKAAFEGVSRISLRALHLHQRRGRPWHAECQACSQGWRHPLHRLRCHHRWLLLRRSRNLRDWQTPSRASRNSSM